MLGSTAVIQQVFALIRKVSATPVPVLILGESGTGKERIARAIHRGSERRSGPFVPINCGGIPESLIESELFGHEKGAFTGAHAQQIGLIESAAGGTLFLDEIGELSPALQVKLLRFLQDGLIQRVGGRRLLRVDTRTVAATHVDLHEAMRRGGFRQDLYYRLAVVTIRVPPLRERQGDIPYLAEAFVSHCCVEIGRASPPKLMPSALAALSNHDWPGNIRELENCIRRAVILCDGTAIVQADLGLNAAQGSRGLRLNEAREALERNLVQRALQLNGGNMSAAALDLGVSRPTLYDLMNRLGLRRPSGTVESCRTDTVKRLDSSNENGRTSDAEASIAVVDAWRLPGV
jgi:two-component system NtrC family response regulator